MANYHEYRVHEQRDPLKIVGGSGTDLAGAPVICVSGIARPKETGDWVALSIPCAEKLCSLLSRRQLALRLDMFAEGDQFKRALGRFGWDQDLRWRVSTCTGDPRKFTDFDTA